MGNMFAISREWRLLFNYKLIRKWLSGLSAIADKTRIFLTKSKDKLCHDEFLSRVLHPLKISKLSNFVSAWSAHETSWHSLPMDSNSSFRIHRTSFQSFKVHEFCNKRKLMPSRLILVSSITSWWQLLRQMASKTQSPFTPSLTFFLLALDTKKYFYHISSVLSGVLMFRTYK